MSDIWVTADHHFGHANIIKYCDRPFADVEEMDAGLVEAWNRCVKPGDTVYHLGDLAYGRGGRSVEDYLGMLNGRILLVPGNHDTRQAIEAVSRHPEHVLCPPIVEMKPEGSDLLLGRRWLGCGSGREHLPAGVYGVDCLQRPGLEKGPQDATGL